MLLKIEWTKYTRTAGVQKNLVKKRREIHFSIFTENWNWDLKFLFGFDNENKERNKIKILFHFKTRIECPFRPVCVYFVHSNFNCIFWWKIDFYPNFSLILISYSLIRFWILKHKSIMEIQFLKAKFNPIAIFGSRNIFH